MLCKKIYTLINHKADVSYRSKESYLLFHYKCLNFRIPSVKLFSTYNSMKIMCKLIIYNKILILSIINTGYILLSFYS